MKTHKKPVIRVRAHKETGEIITVKEYDNGNVIGSVLVQLDAPMKAGRNGFAVKDKRAGFYKVSGEDMISEFEEIMAGVKDGDEFPLPVKIVVKESTRPFYEGQEPKLNVSTDEIVTIAGRPIYMSQEVVDIDSEETDSLIRSEEQLLKHLADLEKLEGSSESPVAVQGEASPQPAVNP